MVRQQGTVGRGVLLGLLVLAVVGCADQPGPEKNAQPALKNEQLAVETLEKLDGWVWRDPERPGNPVVRVRFYHTKITDAGLKELIAFKSLEELQLGAAVTDAGLKELKELKSLKQLSLSRTQVT